VNDAAHAAPSTTRLWQYRATILPIQIKGPCHLAAKSRHPVAELHRIGRAVCAFRKEPRIMELQFIFPSRQNIFPQSAEKFP
jgi:hypothetical protein